MPPLVLNLPFGLSVDISFWEIISTLPTWEKVGAIYAIIGWPILVVVFWYALLMLHKFYRNVLEQKTWKWVLLAIDIPEEVLQGPKAVEHIFANLHGSALYANLAEKWWYGKYQKWFSFEIVSIEGYIQFLIRTEIEYRDLVEAAVYAQYPEAEITEVEDYVDNIPSKYPDDKYDILGWEFILEQSDVYPIRTYQEFEHSISKDVVFNDPMAGILENFSRIGPGENFWFQIIILPDITEAKWKEKGIKEAKKIIAEQGEPPKKDTLLNKMGDIPQKLAQEAINVWDWNFEAEEASIKKEARPGSMMDLTPGLKNTIEAIEDKISKQGYLTKIRVLYAADKSVYNVHKCMEGFIGSMKQFFNTSRNGFKPVNFTFASYAFKNYRETYRKNFMVSSYKRRKPNMGASPIMLNMEELATIWHFPMSFVKTPLLQKSALKRAEPPIDLPLDSLPPGLAFGEDEAEATSKVQEFITDAQGTIPIEEVASELGDDQPNTDKTEFTKDLPYG